MITQAIKNRRSIIEQSRALGVFTKDVIEDIDVLIGAAETANGLLSFLDDVYWPTDQSPLFWAERIEAMRAALDRVKERGSMIQPPIKDWTTPILHRNVKIGPFVYADHEWLNVRVRAIWIFGRLVRRWRVR